MGVRLHALVGAAASSRDMDAGAAEATAGDRQAAVMAARQKANQGACTKRQ
jgi:hypothetical protein